MICKWVSSSKSVKINQIVKCFNLTCRQNHDECFFHRTWLRTHPHTHTHRQIKKSLDKNDQIRLCVHVRQNFASQFGCQRLFLNVFYFLTNAHKHTHTHTPFLSPKHRLIERFRRQFIKRRTQQSDVEMKDDLGCWCCTWMVMMMKWFWCENCCQTNSNVTTKVTKEIHFLWQTNTE